MPGMWRCARVGSCPPESTPRAFRRAGVSGVARAMGPPGQAPPAIQVRNGGAVAAGVIGGMILGGIIASQAPRYYGYPYGYPAYGYPAYQPYPAGDAAIAYCARRFRSYDPYSMTYLGHDGFRHSCP